jgi:Family of unknown function (DUF6913)
MSVIGTKILSALNSASKEKIRRGALKPFEAASSIGIIYTWEDVKKEALISDFIEKINQERNVDSLCFNPDKNNILDTTRPVFSINELSILGKINSPDALNFLDKKFDYLFHLDLKLSEITEVLLIKSKARCRIGLHSDRLGSPYELMIGINESAGLDNLIEQMLKYVNAIK